MDALAVLCLFGGHAPSPDPAANGRLRFSHCRRCGHDIFQSGTAPWRRPAKGFRIVWRPVQRIAPPAAATALPAPEADDDDSFAWAKTAGAPPRTADPGDFMADVTADDDALLAYSAPRSGS